MEIGIEDVNDPSATLHSFIEHSKSWVPLVDFSPGFSHTSPRRRKPKPPDCPPPDHLMARSLRLDVSQPAAASIVATALLKSTPVAKYLIMMMSLRTRPIASLDVICWQRWGQFVLARQPPEIVYLNLMLTTDLKAVCSVFTSSLRF